ncbi:unnamed protein product [Rotaria sp. Silwood2]|nr:unnamed protein product [Rotaria sp. Silwood2]CAF2998952.1 unnamed protein product [Rotaria sp. Silwood2]CAF3041431.1 unnamed protein product [Rotaria sp. Silwood2]CAF3372278.1 unnamed protein product [Rotaria sp. Silwood2]CAF4147716.1 unnamed protein product [Rotaria sp. Silwood2]
MIDRIKSIVFREARDAGATFINRQWIVDKIHRTTRFVSEWWKKSYDQCFADYSNADPKLKLSQAGQDIIREASEYVTRRTINDYRHREGLKPFHVISKPLKSETHISDRLWLCNWLKEWTEEDGRYREMVKHQACIGVFIMFTCKRLLWVIKDKGESWTGQYFRDIILT